MDISGESIQKKRKELGVTQKELADSIGVSYQTIQNWESGKSIPRSKHQIIGIFLNSEKPVPKSTVETPEIVSKGNAEIVTSPKSKAQRSKHDGLLVPFYDIDFSAGNDLVLVDNNKIAPDYYMDVPEFSGCTAFKAYSDSMENLIKSGNILFGTKVEEWQLHLEYGQIYGIICNDGRRYLKYIRKFNENPKEYFLLKSENLNYDDFEIPKVAIRSIWLIHGWLNKRT